MSFILTKIKGESITPKGDFYISLTVRTKEIYNFLWIFAYFFVILPQENRTNA